MSSGRFDNASLTAVSPSLISAPLQMSSYAATFTQGHTLEHFRFTYRHCNIVQGGFFLKKKPLGIPISVKSRIENAVGAGTMSPETEWPEQKVVDLRCLARGVRWALTIEGAAGLCVYAIWHLLRLWL